MPTDPSVPSERGALIIRLGGVGRGHRRDGGQKASERRYAEQAFTDKRTIVEKRGKCSGCRRQVSMLVSTPYDPRTYLCADCGGTA